MAFAAALLAITLNFLQPVAHAAMMRDGGPQAAALLWGVFCQPSTGDQDADAAPAAATRAHECCLGLSHAASLTEPSTSFVAVDGTAAIVRPLEQAQSLTPVGIRDGPSQPRAPPLHA